MILVDTSAWIHAFRRGERSDLRKIVPQRPIVTCLPVLQDVLQGFDDERAWRVAREAMLALPMVESPLGIDVFEQAIALRRAARRSGSTVRSSVACLIAACALRNDLEILHVDRDYEALAKVSGLRQRSILG